MEKIQEKINLPMMKSSRSEHVPAGMRQVMRKVSRGINATPSRESGLSRPGTGNQGRHKSRLQEAAEVAEDVVLAAASGKSGGYDPGGCGEM